MQKPSPTLFQIISTDYLGQNFFVMTFGGWVIYGVDALFQGHTTFFLAVLAAILTPTGLATFYWRYSIITSAFTDGMETDGKITDIQTVSSGKSKQDYIIHYEWNFKGETYQYKNRVKKNAFAKKLTRGQQVTLLMREETPHIAFIKDIYLRNP